MLRLGLHVKIFINNNVLGQATTKSHLFEYVMINYSAYREKCVYVLEVGSIFYNNNSRASRQTSNKMTMKCALS